VCINISRNAHGGVGPCWPHSTRSRRLQPPRRRGSHKNKDLPDDPPFLEHNSRIPAERTPPIRRNAPPPRIFSTRLSRSTTRTVFMWARLVQPMSRCCQGRPAHRRFTDESLAGSSTIYLVRAGCGVEPARSSAGPSSFSTYGHASVHWSDAQGTQWFPGRARRVELLRDRPKPLNGERLRVHPACPTQKGRLSRQRRCDRGDLVTSSRRRHQTRESPPISSGTRAESVAHHSFRRRPTS